MISLVSFNLNSLNENSKNLWVEFISWFLNTIKKTINSDEYLLQKCQLNLILNIPWKMIWKFPIKRKFWCYFSLHWFLSSWMWHWSLLSLYIWLGEEKPKHLVMAQIWDSFMEETSAFKISGVTHTKGMGFLPLYSVILYAVTFQRW